MSLSDLAAILTCFFIMMLSMARPPAPDDLIGRRFDPFASVERGLGDPEQDAGLYQPDPITSTSALDYLRTILETKIATADHIVPIIIDRTAKGVRVEVDKNLIRFNKDDPLPSAVGSLLDTAVRFIGARRGYVTRLTAASDGRPADTLADAVVFSGRSARRYGLEIDEVAVRLDDDGVVGPRPGRLWLDIEVRKP